MKAIETVYNGYKFRSRLEARWAVFFDTLGIKYQYEVEGYDLDGLWYLPDFQIPRVGIGGSDLFVEVKPFEATDSELAKIYNLASESKTSSMIIQGQPYPAEYNITFIEMWGGDFGPDHNFDKPNVITRLQIIEEIIDCTLPGFPDFAEYQRDIYMTNGKKKIFAYQFMQNIPYKEWGHPDYATKMLLPAYVAARQARFEHK